MGGGRRGGGGAQANSRANQGTGKAQGQSEAKQRSSTAAAAAVPQPPGLGKADSIGTGTEKSRRTCLHTQLRKTRICMYHLRGACQYNDDCAFAHTMAEINDTPDLSKTRLCKVFLNEGNCPDPECSFAHGEEELRSTNMFFKKTLCMWNEKGKCRNGDQCRFAHGSVELRAGPPKPSSEQTKASPSVASSASTAPSSPSKGRRGQQQQQAQQQQQQQAQQQQKQEQEQRLLLQQQMAQMRLLQQQLLQQQQHIFPNHLGAAAQQAGPEPMKIPIAGLGGGSIQQAHANSPSNMYDEALKGQLEDLRQKISVLSLRCNQIQTRMGSQVDPQMLGVHPDCSTMSGLSTPPGLPKVGSSRGGTDSPVSVSTDCCSPFNQIAHQAPPGLVPESTSFGTSQQQFAEVSMRMAAAQADMVHQMEAARLAIEAQQMGMYMDKLSGQWMTPDMPSPEMAFGM